MKLFWQLDNAIEPELNAGFADVFEDALQLWPIISGSHGRIDPAIIADSGSAAVYRGSGAKLVQGESQIT